ncbi:MAG: hypothetical protein AUK47_19305, partial [Deltaproteobacteria bacterium CG2_30_63_29]
ADEAEFRRDLEQVQAKWGARPGLWLTKVLPFDPALIAECSASLRLEVLALVVDEAIHRCMPQLVAFAQFERELSSAKDVSETQAMILTELMVLQGRAAEAERLERLMVYPAAWGLVAAVTSRREEAMQAFAAAEKLARGRKRRVTRLPEAAGQFQALLLATSNDRTDWQTCGAIAVGHRESDTFLQELIEFRKDTSVFRHSTFIRHSAFNRWDEPDENPIDVLIGGLVERWTDEALTSTAKAISKYAGKAKAASFAWLEDQFRQLIRPGSGGRYPALSSLFVPNAAWERQLESVLATIPLPPSERVAAKKTQKVEQDTRLVWFVEVGRWGVSLEPRIQNAKAKGWTNGRKVALKRLFERDPSIDFLDAHDLAVIKHIERSVSVHRGYMNESFHINEWDAAKALSRHPRVMRNPSAPRAVEIALTEPRVKVVQTKIQTRVSIEPSSGGLTDEGHRILMANFSETQNKIATKLGDGIIIPAAAQARADALIARLAPHFPVESPTAPTLDTANEVTANSTLSLEASRVDDRLELRARVYPLGRSGPQFRPGEGAALVIATQAGVIQRTRRALQAELAGLIALIERVPPLHQAGDGTGDWSFPTLGQAISAISALSEQHIDIEWTTANQFAVAPSLDLEDLGIELKHRAGEFHLTGRLILEDGEAIELTEVFGLLSCSPGRFLALEDGSFLLLTASLFERLERLQAASHRQKDDLLVSGLASSIVEELLSDLEMVETDEEWNSLIDRIRAAETLEPQVPNTLEAELRPYQLEGYCWLSRLAAWGAGACLADDMGLGKTVQAIAVALSRAQYGPTLVVAPTSVCTVWADEAVRFAPTLKPIRLGIDGRTEAIESLGPFDLLIVSYTLMQLEIEALAKVTFATLVLDEAQAIKNPFTQRTKAALQLNGGFRIATTGTPVENRLTELWSLFRFLNPTLLSSYEDFKRRFVMPIEQDKAPKALANLRRLVHPFVLRRTKSEVLTELPARTDVVRRVEMSTTEAAFYEAIRQHALSELDGSKELPTMQLLAWITKLRRACCHPSLVDAELAGVDGCKLEAFDELVEELRSAGHRALVFSQFVGFLSLLRSRLDQAQIPYQYLDGSTPEKARAGIVRAFQAGEGDLFLISLRAGGFGLNLTAADRVIHMDPWWNPAVEDQASDRAHRIGQTRPVTVYRVVVCDSIEERILNLHGRKRALADDLLEGADVGSTLSREEVLRLLDVR